MNAWTGISASSQSVRDRIVRAVQAKLLAMPGVGAVILPTAGRTDADVTQITAALTAGGMAIEMATTHAERDGADELTQIETRKMSFGLVIHLPEVVPTPASGPNWDHQRLADAVHHWIEQLYLPDGLFNWATVAEPAGLALDTVSEGGGGLYFDEMLGTAITESAFTVRYRYTRGNPAEVR